MAKKPVTNKTETEEHKAKMAALKAESDKAADAIMNSNVDANTDNNEVGGEGNVKSDAETAAPEASADIQNPTTNAPSDILNVPEPEPEVVSDADRVEAFQKFTKICRSYPVTTPNEHVIFGFAEIRMTLGDLRKLCGIVR